MSLPAVTHLTLTSIQPLDDTGPTRHGVLLNRGSLPALTHLVSHNHPPGTGDAARLGLGFDELCEQLESLDLDEGANWIGRRLLRAMPRLLKLKHLRVIEPDPDPDRAERPLFRTAIESLPSSLETLDIAAGAYADGILIEMIDTLLDVLDDSARGRYKSLEGLQVLRLPVAAGLGLETREQANVGALLGMVQRVAVKRAVTVEWV